MGGRRDRDRRPARRASLREPRPRLLVVCEGRRTEPEYLRGVVVSLRSSAVEVVIHHERGGPKKVVEMAKRARASAAALAKRQDDPFLAYDEVWCVFDRDEHPHFNAAIDMAQANGLQLAVSNPCFELWLLLHFRESPGARHRDELALLLRRDHVPSYDKGVQFGELAAGVKHAITRAERLAQEAARLGEDPHKNPTTGVFRLIRAIGHE